MGLSNMAACFIESSKTKSASKVEVPGFGNLVTEVTSCQVCHILLVRSKSLDADSQGEDPTRV